MIAKQTTRYTLSYTTTFEKETADRFADGVEAFYGWGGAEVLRYKEGDTLVVEYDHFIETKESVFGA